MRSVKPGVEGMSSTDFILTDLITPLCKIYSFKNLNMPNRIFEHHGDERVPFVPEVKKSKLEILEDELDYLLSGLPEVEDFKLRMPVKYASRLAEVEARIDIETGKKSPKDLPDIEKNAKIKASEEVRAEIAKKEKVREEARARAEERRQQRNQRVLDSANKPETPEENQDTINPEPEETNRLEELNSMTVPELKEVAEKLEIEDLPTKKADIIKAILEAEEKE